MTVRVLIVDDDDDIRTIAALALRTVGKMTVSMARSASDAIEMLQVQQPDLLLLDVMMPGMDGASLFESLQQQPHLAHIPVVFMTARVHGGEIERYLAMGAAGFVAKPFDPMTLAERLRSILRSVPPR
ncbi:MAG: CheY-like chemotaxis protein [Myxococcota bacterium]|jgi:CheY-like chemotaxis protein